MNRRAEASLARCLLDTPRDADRVGRVARAPQRETEHRLAVRLDELASRIRRNIPLGSDPSRFHEEKSEVAREIAAIADELRR
ncbi:MAG TPA: hypothetical protein VKX28_26940 [Xanthobacteraceae bacterium]|nr:hypothetical protein [Xanthobacteraceae bacterium]